MIDLDEEQRAAAEDPAPQLWISAGPGAGKTRVLAARVAHLVTSGRFAPTQVAAVSYTRSMAADLRRRIALAMPESVPCVACSGEGRVDGFDCAECLGAGRIETRLPAVGTLHSLAAGWVRAALRGNLSGAEEIGALRWTQGPDFQIAQPEDVDDLVDVAHHETRKKIPKRDLRAALRLHGPDLVPFTPRTEARRQLAVRNLVTFDDLLRMLHAMVLSARAPEGPPHLCAAVCCLVIDEAQDLSPQHWTILDDWRPRGLTVALDDAQSIYRFMHLRSPADYAATAMARGRLAAAPARHEIGRNYRSARSIVTDTRRIRRVLAADGACSDLEMVPVRPDVPGAVVVEEGDDTSVRSHVAGLIGTEPIFAAEETFAPHQVAVLGRTWEELEAVAEELKAAGIPHAIPERGRDRWASLAGRAVVALARAASRGAIDDQDARTVLRAFGHGDPVPVVAEALLRAMRAGVSLLEALDQHPLARAGLPAGWWPGIATAGTVGRLAEMIEHAELLGGRALAAAARAMASWSGVAFAGEAEDQEPATPGGWLEWLASDESNSVVQMREGHVVLTTVHGAKGLEWPAVVVIGACEGSIPGRMDRSLDDIAEAGRVLYVAATRARDALRIVCPSVLREKVRTPSRWLVSAGLIDAPAPPAT